MTADRIVNDCGIATSAAHLGAHQIGIGELGSAARFFGMALAHIEALVAAGCDAVEGAEAVPILSHQLTETCQAHGILDAAVAHAKQQLHRWENA
ncbi:hypothetical protein [Sphingomonas sp. Leaf25]|uniref:hypothetical protein n=1 Tax=Sphingomonas sp. Leaf25 TaxID=1735692 RepID=UPI0006FB47F2|nr:hypothetical protein [Sphingomonas sp. Leaf25]KQM98759.1 hypothetical protein ASE78_05900 [Sphingomonas sp. Leaf25]